MLIDARCNHCHKFLCQISHDLIGVVRLVCPRCNKENDVSLATVLKEVAVQASEQFPVDQQESIRERTLSAIERIRFNPEKRPHKPTWT